MDSTKGHPELWHSLRFLAFVPDRAKSILHSAEEGLELEIRFLSQLHAWTDSQTGSLCGPESRTFCSGGNIVCQCHGHEPQATVERSNCGQCV